MESDFCNNALQFQSVGTASGHFFPDGMELETQAKQVEQAIKALG